MIPSNASRARPIPYDRHLYKDRHLVELFINKMKHFRRMATRYRILRILCRCSRIHALDAMNVHTT